MKKSKKYIKKLKKSVTENSALYIGFYNSVISEIPPYALLEAIKCIKTFNIENIGDTELLNMLVTEAVKNTSYQDFKKISKYFF
ncbi:hypothetical protein PG275_10350 [Riemerella anatipestifer]|nr:hypothetical protein [Riemerella anatipestifer]